MKGEIKTPVGPVADQSEASWYCQQHPTAEICKNYRVSPVVQALLQKLGNDPEFISSYASWYCQHHPTAEICKNFRINPTKQSLYQLLADDTALLMSYASWYCQHHPTAEICKNFKVAPTGNTGVIAGTVSLSNSLQTLRQGLTKVLGVSAPLNSGDAVIHNGRMFVAL